MGDGVSLTIGAALAGGMVAVALSAVVGFQTFLYFRIFPSDSPHYKLLVTWLWVSDFAHTVMICVSVWLYTVVNFTNPEVVHRIFPTVALTVTLTAFTTLSVNGFYGHRIYKLSKKNWWITGPILFLSVARVAMGLATTVEMMKEKEFPLFAQKFKILFTSGLVLSAFTDVLVSAARYYYLRNLKDGYLTSREMVDTVVVFTINDGALTCIVVVASIICWLSMSNLVYLGIYFTIAKLYSNSVLSTLNLRNWYRHRYDLPRRPRGIIMARQGATGAHGGPESANRAAHFDCVEISAGKPATLDESDGQKHMEVVINRRVDYSGPEFMGSEFILDDLNRNSMHGDCANSVSKDTATDL